MTKQPLKNFALTLSLLGPELIPSTSLAQVGLASKLPGKNLATAAAQTASHQKKTPGSPSYTYTLLSFPGTLSTSAYEINLGATTSKTEIVGAAGEGGFLARVSGKQTVTETYKAVNYPHGPGSGFVNDVNDSGQIVGEYSNGEGGYSGYELSGGKFTPIAVPSAGPLGTEAYGINNSGEIVGGWWDSNNNEHGFTLIGGTYTSFDYPGASATGAFAVNSTGDMVGGYNDANGVGHGFLLSGGTYTSFDFPGAVLTVGYAIKDSGDIVGVYCTTHPMYLNQRGRTWISVEPRGLHDLGDPWRSFYVCGRNQQQRSGGRGVRGRRRARCLVPGDALDGLRIYRRRSERRPSGVHRPCFRGKAKRIPILENRENNMKFALRALLTTILCVWFACAAALAQVQPSPSAPVHSRFGHLLSRMNDRPTLAATHAVQSPGSPEPTLTFGMVDFPGQMDTAGSAANDKGEIIGGYGPDVVGDTVSNHGFSLKGTKFTEIDYPGAGWTEPNAINDSGAIVGQYGASLTGPEQGFELVGKTYTSIVYPGAVDTSAIGINKSGEIVGYWDNGGDGHGFLLSKGIFTSIDVPGAIQTSALGINKAGEIVGLYYSSDGSTHGFLLLSGTFTTIDYPGGYSQNYLWGINDQGVIVGAYGEPTTINGVSYAWEHAFIYQNGQFTNADAPFGPPAATQPFGISNNGVIVGEYVDNSGTVYGYEATVAQ